MNKITLLVIYLLNFSSIFSQVDSITVVNAKWKTVKIAPGISLKQHWFDTLFNSPQNVTILEIRPRSGNHFDLGYEEKELRHTSDFGRSANAIAAINGTFFDTKNGGSVSYIRADRKVINENRLTKNGERAQHQKAAVILNKKKLSIVKWDSSSNWENTLTGNDIMVTGPLLVLDNNNVMLDSNEFVKKRHPRSAIAVTKKNAFF